MRIAFVHSFYSSHLPSGENEVVLAQAEALRQAGHEVLVVARQTDRVIEERGYLTRAGLGVATGLGADPSSDLLKFSPDVVHVHNLFPNFGTRWLGRWVGPLVATLHNFRALCANGLLYRDGHSCTLCPDGHRLASVRYGCYHDSSIASVPLAIRNVRGVTHDAVIRRADIVIVPAERARALYQRYGIPPGRISLVPNFVTEIHSGAKSAPAHERWVSVGRISPEKGFVELVRAWPRGIPLDIIGDGPLRAELEVNAPPEVRLLDMMPAAELRLTLPNYTGLVLPSRCLEGAAPLVVLEALEAGVPVVARNGSGGPDVIRSMGCGGEYDDRNPDSLTATLSTVRDAGGKLRERAREAWHDGFSVARWLSAINRTYQQAGGCV